MRRTRLLVSTLALAALSCSTALQVDPIPESLRNPSLAYFVQNHGKDRNAIDRMIGEQLAAHGLKASNGMENPEQVDVLVIYEDRWQWDMSNYLIHLRIDFRDPETNVLLATGSSYRTSMARAAPETMVSEIIDGMLASQ